ncbi:MAG: hypothetical protein KH100_15650 [Dysgonomonas mossii]|uniref:hypothetical protein n=1 Tax=Dysgonomonas mossii TaxID=163665 RepID=UPI001D34C55E|nr:hypothetical protein [Dysgonomonas mossii]MBS7112617.1 hypothetical protein [Dysgonomonas mossii]
MKTKKEHKIRIYQDSKELPFLNYKRIVQTGDFYYMVKGYEPGDEVEIDVNTLEDKFHDLEEEYARSMNMKSTDVVLYGEIAIVTSEFNKYNLLIMFIEEGIRIHELRSSIIDELNRLFEDFKEDKETMEDLELLLKTVSPDYSEFSLNDVEELVDGFKIQKSDDIYKQKVLVQNRLDKLNNQLLKLKSQVKKTDDEQNEFDIEEQFVNVCIGLETPVNDKHITLYQFGKMVKALIDRSEEINKMKRNAG